MREAFELCPAAAAFRLTPEAKRMAFTRSEGPALQHPRKVPMGRLSAGNLGAKSIQRRSVQRSEVHRAPVRSSERHARELLHPRAGNPPEVLGDHRAGYKGGPNIVDSGGIFVFQAGLQAAPVEP